MPEKPFVALSLGWGVQSWTIAAMVALGELPKIDLAVHADTRHERAHTYKFVETWTPWLQEHGVRVIGTVNRASRGTEVVYGEKEVYVPAYTLMNGKKGQVRRQCTGDWKIDPIRRTLQFTRNGAPVELWLGISLDEMHRAKASDVKYITHRYPLLERRMTRQDCLDWLAAHDLPSPGKSSCVFCPFLNKSAWEQMRAEGGADWNTAVEIDLLIRDVRPPGQLFISNKRVPLEEAIAITSPRGQEIVSEMIRKRDAEILGDDGADDDECGSMHCFL